VTVTVQATAVATADADPNSLCSAFACGRGTTLKANAGITGGAAMPVCCTPTCDSFRCPSGFTSRKNPSNIKGAQKATCCVSGRPKLTVTKQELVIAGVTVADISNETAKALLAKKLAVLLSAKAGTTIGIPVALNTTARAPAGINSQSEIALANHGYATAAAGGTRVIVTGTMPAAGGLAAETAYIAIRVTDSTFTLHENPAAPKRSVLGSTAGMRVARAKPATGRPELKIDSITSSGSGGIKIAYRVSVPASSAVAFASIRGAMDEAVSGPTAAATQVQIASLVATTVGKDPSTVAVTVQATAVATVDAEPQDSWRNWAKSKAALGAAAIVGIVLGVSCCCFLVGLVYRRPTIYVRVPGGKEGQLVKIHASKGTSMKSVWKKVVANEDTPAESQQFQLFRRSAQAGPLAVEGKEGKRTLEDYNVAPVPTRKYCQSAISDQRKEAATLELAPVQVHGTAVADVNVVLPAAGLEGALVLSQAADTAAEL